MAIVLLLSTGQSSVTDVRPPTPRIDLESLVVHQIQAVDDYDDVKGVNSRQRDGFWLLHFLPPGAMSARISGAMLWDGVQKQGGQY